MDPIESLRDVLTSLLRNQADMLRNQAEILARLSVIESKHVQHETYTVEQAAARLDRSHWVVRQWCNLGQAPGAYKGTDGKWRIPHEALLRLQNEGPQRLEVTRSVLAQPA